MINRYFNETAALAKKLIAGNYNTTAHTIARDSLLNSQSYRLLEKDNHDPFIGFRLWKQAAKKILLAKEHFRYIHHQPSDVAIYDGSFKSYDLRVNYVNGQSTDNPGLFIARAFLMFGKGFFGRLLLFFRHALFSWPIIVKCFKSEKRASLALLIFETLENAALLYLLKQYNIRKVYDFAPYQLDSNLAFLLLHRHNIQVVKRPSATPLYLHNSRLLADTLVLTTQYQFEELQHFRDKSIVVSNTLKWMPEYAFDYIHLYAAAGNKPQPPSLTIGYYSHGSWVRKRLGHTEIATKVEQEEEAILAFLKQFLATHPQFSLSVFPHPKEKQLQMRPFAEQYYRERLGKFSFYDAQQSTHFNFDQVDIAVCAFSTVIFDRLFAGHKTLIGIPLSGDFPLPESPLNRICFKDFDAMQQLILTAAAGSREDFFARNGLQEYRYDSYPTGRLLQLGTA